MCTVIARWRPEDRTPVRILAMRDELAGRAFDLPDEWWPERPGVVGGRDRRAGGTWCANDVAAGVTAVVLNRPERREAQAGGASRGVLPLLGVAHGERWSDEVDVAAMAGFNLVLLRPDALTWWAWDGTELRREDLGPGAYQFKPSGRTEQVPGPFGDDAAASSPAMGDIVTDAEAYWGAWLQAVHDATPGDDGSGLLVCRAIGADSYETVFGQLIAARPGWLRLDYRARVARDDGPWTTRIRVGTPGGSQAGPAATRWVS